MCSITPCFATFSIKKGIPRISPRRFAWSSVFRWMIFSFFAAGPGGGGAGGVGGGGAGGGGDGGGGAGPPAHSI